MIKNYLAVNSVLKFRQLFCLILIFFLFSQKSNSQCATPPVGCASTDLSNFGVDSNNNAATIEYDNYISSFHTTIVRTANGSFQTWGERIANDGATNLFSPITINATNYPALGTATPLKVGLGSNSVNTGQGILLATDGLYAWSNEGQVLDNSITSSTVFQKVTIGGNANGLPTGMVPGDVKMMFVTHQTIAITTCGGDVWVLSQNANVRANGAGGNATTWSRVTTDAVGNPFLTNVVVCRGAAGALMALKSDGTVYTWGTNVYRGNNTAGIAAQTRATQMTLPVGITTKMIGATMNTATSNHSYYVLATNGNLYSLGENGTRQLGDRTTISRLAWVQPTYPSAGNPVMSDIKWISPQEHDGQFAFVNVINTTRNMYAFGSNDNNCIGTAANPSDPVMPGGLAAADAILTVETGGHTSMVVKNCDPNFGYVGHRINGSMGSGSTGSGNEASYTFSTAPVQICGAESIPIIQPISTGTGPTSNYCAGSSVLLEPSPAGGTLVVLSGPGTLVGNLLNFTGLGTVVVRYTLPTACGGSSVVTRNFVTEYCSEDLQVVKTVSNPNPSVGSNVTFTITATNNGPYNTYGVSVNDVLPAGYTFVSATPSTGTWTAPNWTIGNMANGASATLTIVATVRATGTYANTATISGVEPDSNNANNTSTVTPVVQSNLSVTKTVSNPNPSVGSNVTFTITVGNAGPSNATSVVVNDVLPAGYTFVSATPSTGTWTAPNWTIGNLANGGSATLTIVATVRSTGSYANTATVTGAETDPTPGNNTSTVTPVVQSNLSITKTVSNPTPNVGSNVTFTLTASNAGPSNATGVSVNDVLPAGYTFVSATPSTGTWTAPNWSIGTLANGATATLTIVASVNAAGPYANTATITGTENDPTPGNNTSTVTPVPVAQANLAIVKTVSNPTPNVGSNVTFTLTASNAGPSNATGVSVNDVLPAGYTFVSATPSTGTWTAPNWSIGTLANGATATITIVASVNAAGPYANTATITGSEIDPTPGNNTSTVTPVPVAQANLAIVKTVSNPTPNVGSNVTFTLTASNAGPSNATGVSVNDVLPAGYTFVSATPSTGTWTAPNWSIGTLANGATATITIVASVNAAGPYANTATITGSEIDPTPGNNTSTVTPVPVAQANLAIVKTVSNPTPNVGSNVTFTLTASNAGPSNATGVSVNDVLPAGYTFVSATPSTGTWTAPNWSIGTLANGATATITIVASVNAAGPYANTATITGTEIDPTPGNNTSTATTAPISIIDAVIDPAVTVSSGSAVTILPGSVIGNDTLNGNPVTITNTNVTPAAAGPLSVDADGVISVAANTPSGTYVITYQLCEADPATGLSIVPANCDTATATVIVNNVIDAVIDPAVTVSSGSAVTILPGSVIGNDTLNGNPVTITNTNVTPAAAGPLSVDADGVISVAANTPSGTYIITYQLCEADPATGLSIVPANCDTATATVIVNNVIDAVIDPAVTVSSGSAVTILPGSVIGNDTLNGNPVTITNTNVTPAAAGPLSVDADGIVSVAANTPSGTYIITYQLCEADPATGLSIVPANCDTATATVIVNNVIDAVIDPAVTVSSGSAVTILPGSVIGNDTLNGNPVTTTNTNVTPAAAGPLSVDADGIVSVAANTPSGTYIITYQLCEADPATGVSIVPANCDTATATVIVNNVIDAVIDPAVTVSSGSAVTILPGSVIGNDTLNGNPVTITNTNVTPAAAGPLSVDADGVISVAANTPSGTYVITYQLCEADPATGLSVVPANCDTATATVIVNNVIDAVIDPAVTVSSGSAVTILPGSVIGNDTLNGNPVTTTNTNVTPAAAGPLSVDADGIVSVAANTPSGTYVITYQLCEADPATGLSIVPANCDTATATVIVNNVIDAVIDPAVTVSSGSAVTILPGSVIGNDTLNGNPVTIANTNVTPAAAGPLSVDADGVISVAANTPSGTYVITYQLCEADPATGLSVVPANCDTATATVIVNNVIDAVIDPAVTVSSGSAVTIVPGSVIGNDTLNGNPVTIANTNVTPAAAGPLSVDADGIVSVAANTPSGTYVITYQLCEADPATGLSIVPANCDTATATVIVNNVIDAVIDPAVTVSSGSAVTILPGSVIGNDTLNGNP
ncbi:DUF11 domain-containing protein, partial [Flavobacterium humi]